MGLTQTLKRHLLKSDLFFFLMMMARGTVQYHAEQKVWKELGSRKSLELLSLVEHKNDKRAELVVRAFICHPNRYHTGMLEGVKCP